MHKKIIALLLTVFFTFQVPATAGAFYCYAEGYTLSHAILKSGN
ncbi:MAG: hypothetical protein ACOX3D_09200 [Syntrophomonadales bacterium]